MAENVLCYIEVESFPDGGVSCYGPYTDKQEAERHLTARRWRHKKDHDQWEVHKKVARIKSLPCNPRNRLPHSESHLPGWAQGLDD